jgi:hypothetical protein
MPGSNSPRQSTPFYGHLTQAQFQACIAILNDPNAREGDKETAPIALQLAKQVNDINVQAMQNVTTMFMNSMNNLAGLM